MARTSKKAKGESIGKRIRARRLQLGMTQADVAAKVKCRPNYIGYLESGQRRPSMQLIERLSKALDMDEATLLAGWFPSVARLQAGTDGPVPTDGWEAFRGDKGLLTRHGVSPAELAALGAMTSTLGSLRSPRDYLFVLDAVRRGRLDT